jgi:prepilin signal peptidase PulO-like enzyme (type II secretory pathway)
VPDDAAAVDVVDGARVAVVDVQRSTHPIGPALVVIVLVVIVAAAIVGGGGAVLVGGAVAVALAFAKLGAGLIVVVTIIMSADVAVQGLRGDAELRKVGCFTRVERTRR